MQTITFLGSSGQNWMVVITKKAISVSVIFCIFLCSCFYNPYSSKKPSEYGKAEWICEEYNVSFQADPENKNDAYYSEGEILIDGQTWACEFWFTWRISELTINVFLTVDESVSGNKKKVTYQKTTEGTYTISSESLTFHIDKEKDDIFGGKVENLTFIRTEK